MSSGTFLPRVLLDLVHQQGARPVTFVDPATRAVEKIEGFLGIPRGVGVLHLDLHEQSVPEGEERFFQKGIPDGQSLCLEDILAGGFRGKSGLPSLHPSDHVTDLVGTVSPRHPVRNAYPLNGRLLRQNRRAAEREEQRRQQSARALRQR